MKKIFILCSFLVFSLLIGCSSDSNQLIMVTEAGFAPYEFYQNGQIVGVDIEIAKEIAKSMNKELVIKDIAFDSIINEINTGKADFAAAGMSITPERLEEVDFTIEYATSNQVVVVKKGSSLTNINELDGKRISVQLGTVADSYAEENYKNSEIIRQKKYLSSSEDVKNGKADCIIMDLLPAKELVKENNDLVILDGILFTDKYGMAVKKGNTELLEKINNVLKRLMEENKIEEYTIHFSGE